MSDDEPTPAEPEAEPATASQVPPYRAALGHLQAYVEVSAELLRACDAQLFRYGMPDENPLRQRIAKCLSGDFPWQADLPKPTPTPKPPPRRR